MRQNGILMHITSLPAPYGVGTMGACAREFVVFLEKAGQSCWQILPICPTSYGDSPYQSFSTYAGNPYLIDLDDLAEDELLLPEEYQSIDWGTALDSVDYGTIYGARFDVLRLAVARLRATERAELTEFVHDSASWLEDYAMFMALKTHNGGAAWSTWPEEIRRREPEALELVRSELAEDMDFWRCVQYLFFHQWWKLKAYANEHGISIVGDVPIYVAGDSVDVWANPTQFQLDEDLMPTEVAGCPPDGFSEDGQLWGNPLFDWDTMEQDGYKWWIERLSYQCATYDILRIDHFRGFEAYYAIPFGDTTARRGEWRKGPGTAFFQAIDEAIGRQNIIAEDLGFLTEGVYEMLAATGFPGMKVLQFAFDSRDGESGYLPHDYPQNCVAYIGTHDNNTILGWLEEAPANDIAYAKDYLRLNEQEGMALGMMRGLWASAANLTVVLMQDVLELDGEARMNTPSTVGTNWKWRALPDSYTDEMAEKLRHEMQVYHRLSSHKK